MADVGAVLMHAAMREDVIDLEPGRDRRHFEFPDDAVHADLAVGKAVAVMIQRPGPQQALCFGIRLKVGVDVLAQRRHDATSAGISLLSGTCRQSAIASKSRMSSAISPIRRLLRYGGVHPSPPARMAADRGVSPRSAPTSAVTRS